jgi:hypothetical protein
MRERVKIGDIVDPLAPGVHPAKVLELPMEHIEVQRNPLALSTAEAGGGENVM